MSPHHGRTGKQGKIELLSQWMLEGWAEQFIFCHWDIFLCHDEGGVLWLWKNTNFIRSSPQDILVFNHRHVLAMRKKYTVSNLQQKKWKAVVPYISLFQSKNLRSLTISVEGKFYKVLTYVNVSDQSSILTHETKMLISVCWKSFLAFNVLHMTRTDGWIQNFKQRRDIIALKRQYVYSALLCDESLRSDGTQNDPGYPGNELVWLSRRLGGLQGLK